MRAAMFSGKDVIVQERPDPEPGTGEVLVRIRAAGLNGGDLLQRAGFYPAPSGSPPDIPGLELAGEVVAVGASAMRFAVGDRVMGIVGGGAQAELLQVHERQLMPVPAALPDDQAGGFPEAFTTAHDALVTQGGLTVGSRLLVHGAAGGVGTAAVQLGRLLGAHVTATVSAEGSRKAVAALGADAVLDPADFVEHGPFDVILELVGAPNLPGNVRALAVDGCIVVIGVGAGPEAELNLLELMGKRGRICASTLRARPLEEKALTARRLEEQVLPAVAAGRLVVPLARTFPLDEVAAAYDQFAASGKVGKVVLLP